jgi:hypothetical protein
MHLSVKNPLSQPAEHLAKAALIHDAGFLAAFDQLGGRRLPGRRPAIFQAKRLSATIDPGSAAGLAPNAALYAGLLLGPNVAPHAAAGLAPNAALHAAPLFGPDFAPHAAAGLAPGAALRAATLVGADVPLDTAPDVPLEAACAGSALDIGTDADRDSLRQRR